jgi:flagellar biosynthesis protein FlhF
MEMKKIVAPDMRTALRLVREQLGPDAIILSNRRVEQGIEVVSALEVPQQETGAGNVTAQPVASVLPARRDTRFSEVAEIPVPVEELQKTEIPTLDNRVDPEELSQLQAMQAELRGMRDLLAQQLGTMSWQNYSSNNPVQASLCRKLQTMGLPASVARQCLPESTTGDSLQNAWRNTLAKLVNLTPATGDITAAGGRFALVGPTGVGKTTTIGKLAARYVLENGSDSVALVTLDSYRIGAHEQLRIIGRILGIPLKVVSDLSKLPGVLRSLSSKSLVLIDTAGFNHQDERLMRQLQALGDEEGLRNLLVLSANSQPEAMKAAYHTYKRAGLAGAVLTKLDDTCSLGESFGVLIDQQLPLAYVTDGQEIPEDLKVGRAIDLVSRAVTLMKRRQVDDNDQMEDMPSFWSGILGQGDALAI